MILTEEELNETSEELTYDIESVPGIKTLVSLIESHRELLKANRELSDKNMKYKEEFNTMNDLIEHAERIMEVLPQGMAVGTWRKKYKRSLEGRTHE